MVVAVLVHQETDGAAMHAVDRLARGHEPVQGLQHEAVAAERDDDVGLRGRYLAVALGQPPQRLLGLGVGGRRDTRRGYEWTPIWNARFSSIRPIPRLSRRSGQGAPSWSNAWPPASTSCPAWCRTIGGRAAASGVGGGWW